MPETIISQYARAYNSPIETNRQVNTSTDRDNISSSVRWRGMLVHVIADDVTYELVGGIDNGSWQPLAGLQDAPSDGKTYGRRDGDWEILDFGQEKLLFKFPNALVTGTGLNELFTDTIPAGSFPNDTDAIEIFTFWKSGSGVLSTDVLLRFDFGSVGLDIDAFGNHSGSLSYIMRGYVQRKSSTQIDVSIHGYISGEVVEILNTTSTVTANAENNFQIQAQDSGGNDGLELLGGYVRKI